MLTSKKRFLVLFGTILLISIFTSIFFNIFNNKCFAIVPQSYEFYVNDTANIINAENEKYIIDINKKLYEKTGAQIVVVSVNNLEGKSIEDYATELFRDYGIGDKEKNNGVLFLVSVEDRKTRIEVGYGLEGKLTDGKTGRILDQYVVPYFSDNNWNDGIKHGFDAILREICEEYSITIDGADSPPHHEVNEKFNITVYISSFIVFVICLINRHVFSRRVQTKWLVATRTCYFCYHNLIYLF